MNSVNRHEGLNSLTHGVAAAISLVGLVLLVVFAARYGTVWHVVSFSIYGTTMVLLFTASTCYHAVRNPEIKKILRIVDHSAIFLLIAGTYTPITLTALRGPLGWSLFGCVWGIAAVGIALKVFFTGRFRVLSTLLYLLMGWLVVFAVRPICMQIPRAGLLWLLAGGLAYTGGVVFYIGKSIPCNHAIWHLFVFAGSLCHYVAIFFYML
ncbi:MAG: hemolysin III family protein [Kiritimatiellae bacterium]|nr:hemolysin III family protein [Kiritimatiellia bacterium]